MMKNIFKVTALVFISLLMVTSSCTKEDAVIIGDNHLQAIVEDFNDDLVLEEILDEVLEDLERYDFFKSADVCPVKTIEQPEDGKYPKIVTKDFGDGCYKNEYSRMRSGKILITIDGPWRKKGSVREVAFENYTHGNALIEGSKRIECMGVSDDGFLWYKVEGNLKLTREKDGEELTIQREVNKRRYLINGLDDKEVPREWLIEGKVKVEKSNGTSYKMKIAEPLWRIKGCKWFQAGLKHIEIGENLIQIDYSFVGPEESDCDSWIERWVNEEEAEEIDLSEKHKSE